MYVTIIISVFLQTMKTLNFGISSRSSIGASEDSGLLSTHRPCELEGISGRETRTRVITMKDSGPESHEI